MTAQGRQLPDSVARALCVLVVLILLWRVGAAGYEALSERERPATDDALRTSMQAQTPAAFWRERLSRNPADAAALVALGLQSESEGRPDDARAAMRHAIRLAPVDQEVLGAAAHLSLRTGEATPALAILRRLVELHPEASNEVWPVLSAALDSRKYGDFFDRLARDNPRWWPAFFRIACEQGRNPDAIQALFAIRVDARLATDDERRCVIARLQRNGEWRAAYQLWLNSLPVERRRQVGYIFNGDFESPLSNLGFDWLVPGGDGAVVTTEKIDGAIGEKALHVTFSNRPYKGAPIYQYLMLDPGRYRFEGQGRVEGLASWLGVQWVLSCPPRSGTARQMLARGDRFLGSSGWTNFGLSFVVPTDCPLQVLSLELVSQAQGVPPRGGESRLRGGVWFEQLRVRVEDTPGGGR